MLKSQYINCFVVLQVSFLLPKNFSEIKVMLFYKGEKDLPTENPPTEGFKDYLKKQSEEASKGSSRSVEKSS